MTRRNISGEVCVQLSPQMAEVESVVNGGEVADHPTVSEPEETTSKSGQMVAPALRVEELREGEGNSSSSYLSVSEEEGSLSVGELSDGGGKSGDEASSKEFVPPDEELRNQIIQQVEFYFSDVNILKDAFLLKHVRRNKQGYVSLKLITSFRKVKKMTKDYRVVAYSLKHSSELELNEESTKVRRKNPLPDYDETTPSRTVVAVNMPIETPTVETVAELFAKCGDIALVRILKPGKPLPPDVKKYINKHPELGSAVCAVVEFEHHESAVKACETMTNDMDWRNGLRVVLLAQQKKGKTPKEKTSKTDGEVQGNQVKAKSPEPSPSQESNHVQDSNSLNTQQVGPEGDADDADSSTREGRKQKKKKGKKGRLDELSASRSPQRSSGSEAEGPDAPSWRGHHRQSSGGSYTGRSSLSPHRDDFGGENEGADSASWRSNRRGSGGSFTGRSSLSPHPDPNRLSPCTTPRSSPKSSPRSSPRASPTARRRVIGKSPLAVDGSSPAGSPRPSPCVSPETRRKNSSDVDPGSSPSSPWVQRRLRAQTEVTASPGASPRLTRRLPDGTTLVVPRMANMEGVMRQPQGPDGTKGFYGGMGRGKIRSETM